MKNIVITGSTRGIGFGLAEEFLQKGHKVVISGRKEETVQQKVELLSMSHSGRISGKACDVTSPEQLLALWNFAAKEFGTIDIWINNAGIAHPQQPFIEHTPQEIKQGIEVNLTSMMIGTQIALKGMIDQGSGAIYNMLGMGSTGRITPGLTLYGTSKAAHPYFHKAITLEAKEHSIITGTISPGMVITDMITSQYKKNPEEFEKNKKIFNLIANKVETITPVLSKKILENTQSGANLKHEPSYVMFLRFLTAPFSKRDIFSD